MKSAKPQIGIRQAKASDTKGLGMIRFGKSWRDKTKYVIQEFECDDKAKKDLFEVGMKALANDKEAVIAYVIRRALEGFVKCKK